MAITDVPVKIDIRDYPEQRLPLSMLVRYLFFLNRRPISKSNQHYLKRRLAGLKTLSELIRGTDNYHLNQIVQLLDRTNPQNFYLLSEKLQYMLVPFTYALDEMPMDTIVSNNPPAELVAPNAQILLLCGPAIGIGDEIILFSLPAQIKECYPGATITVLSAYSGLWDRVRDVDEILRYRDDVEMLQALRSEAPYDRFDTVILADFDRPTLYPAICQENKLARYIEISIGTQSFFVADNAQRVLHRAPRLVPYYTNFYDSMDELISWLGLSPNSVNRFSDLVPRQRPRSDESFWLYVSPFTSKYDPSEIYWSELLTQLLANVEDIPIRCVLDSGPNIVTRQFVESVAQASTVRTPANVTFEVAEAEDPDMPGLQAAFSWMEQAHMTICVDSFSAHAAPLFGCPTCIIAAPGLENWRVPHEQSFYFRYDEAIPDLVYGLRQIMNKQMVDFTKADSIQLMLTESEQDLVDATQRLQQIFVTASGALYEVNGASTNGHTAKETNQIANSIDFNEMLNQYNVFVDAYKSTLNGWDALAEKFGVIMNDTDYMHPVAQPAASRLAAQEDGVTPHIQVDFQSDMRRHLHNRWLQWQNSNLCKYLGMVLHADNVEN